MKSFYLRHRSALLLPVFVTMCVKGIVNGEIFFVVLGAMYTGAHIETLLGNPSAEVQAKARAEAENAPAPASPS